MAVAKLQIVEVLEKWFGGHRAFHLTMPMQDMTWALTFEDKAHEGSLHQLWPQTDPLPGILPDSWSYFVGWSSMLCTVITYQYYSSPSSLRSFICTCPLTQLLNKRKSSLSSPSLAFKFVGGVVHWRVGGQEQWRRAEGHKKRERIGHQ
jgi:hypothetical protein